MSDDAQPGQEPVDESTRSEPLDLDEGPDVVIAQQNTGPGNELGGGEFPDPDTPPTDAAPGEDAEGAEHRRQRDADGEVREAVRETYGTTEDRARAAEEGQTDRQT